MPYPSKRSRPIADKLVRNMKKHICGTVIDLKAVMAGRATAEELPKTVAARLPDVPESRPHSTTNSR